MHALYAENSISVDHGAAGGIDKKRTAMLMFICEEPTLKSRISRRRAEVDIA